MDRTVYVSSDLNYVIQYNIEIGNYQIIDITNNRMISQKWWSICNKQNKYKQQASKTIITFSETVVLNKTTTKVASKSMNS